MAKVTCHHDSLPAVDHIRKRASDRMQPELKKILISVLEVDTISDDDSVETIAAWDSVRHLTLVLAIEEEFGISLDADLIPGLTSVGALAAVVEAGGAAAGS